MSVVVNQQPEHQFNAMWYTEPWLSCTLYDYTWYFPGIPHGTVRVLHVQLCNEFTTHWKCSLVLNLVPGIVSGTKRDCTCTARSVVQWIHYTTDNCTWSVVSLIFPTWSSRHPVHEKVEKSKNVRDVVIRLRELFSLESFPKGCSRVFP